jgi:DnaK suppressor protein
MNIEHFRNKLLEKERELVSTLASVEDQARAAGDVEVRDAADDASAAEGTSVNLEEAAMMSQTLREVRDALQRIKDGSYGKCIACGRQIERARLEAVPWASYCLEDQEKEDARKGAHGGSTL